MFLVGLNGPVFRQGMAHLVDADWFELCVRRSDWHFDDCSFEDRALIRHCMTGLTYLISPDRTGPLAVRQISSECCACDEDLDPDYVVGHAARHVTAHVTRIIAARRSLHEGAIYFRYPRATDPEEVLDPVTEDAPPIAITALSDPALIATWSDGDTDLFPSGQAVPTTRGASES